jgi:hypothetical protein
MTILAVSPFSGACGISEYMHYLADALTAQGLPVDVEENLHPSAVLGRKTLLPITLLNYQAALLSQWHPEHIREVQAKGSKVVVVWHDSGVPNSDHCRAVCAAADAFILHEPFDDVPGNGYYLRQGVPEWQNPFYFEILRSQQVEKGLWWYDQPVVGSVGLSLGYRNFDLLCEGAALAGWGVLLIASTATDEDMARWQTINPATAVVRQFLPRDQVISYLSGCSATANLVVTNNAGTSGAIRQCLAARKPIIAFRSRQFRDLEHEPAIRWLDNGTASSVATALCPADHSLHAGLDYQVVQLAHVDSWTRRGKEIAAIIRELL